MTTDRHDQILNNVAEEWADLKQTDFATKAELCEVILTLMDQKEAMRQQVHASNMEALKLRYVVVCTKIERDIALGKITAEEAGIPVRPLTDEQLEAAMTEFRTTKPT